MIVVRMKKESSDVNSGIEGPPPPFGVITVVFRGWGKYSHPPSPLQECEIRDHPTRIGLTNNGVESKGRHYVSKFST